ncbi:MAG: hypothetical protein LUG52_07245 [Clostridia bacterium]|nr:hypothetical protein [Clostridia bacterium]
MYRIKRITALMLCVAMLAAFVPQAAFAADEAEDGIYQITNGYLIYSYNAKTGGFAIETDEGHPKKKYDNNMPLLYAEDSDRSNGTSFVTVRINGDDYIFGQSYGFFNMATTIGEPVISEGGRLMEIDWSIKGITVTMSVALGTTENTDTIGNAGLAFEVTNNSGSDAEVSVRLLLDTALGEVDAPYIVVDDSTTTIAVETEWSGESVPSQIRNVDSLTNTRAVSYILPKGWQGGVEPTKIIAGHWANLANTRYEYTADKYCDFTNASNTYRVADAAVALYWEGRTLSDGESYCAETLYGIGNFSSDTGEYVGINVTDYEKLEMNSSEDGYENNGEFTVVFEIDNTLDDSIDLTDISIAVTAEDEYFEVLNSSGDVVDVYQTTYDQLL